MNRRASLLFAGTCVIAAQLAAQNPTVLTTGLSGPMRLIVTSVGNLLVTETSPSPNEGRVTMVTRAGGRRPVISGLPSGTEVQGGPSGPTALALRDRTLYIAIGGGDMERPGPRPGTSVPNPAGPSSPLFCSVLKAEFGGEVDLLTTGFTLPAADHLKLADGESVVLTNEQGDRVTLSVLSQFRPYIPHPTSIHKFSNPFSLALAGDTLYVADASMNTLVSIDTATGRTRTLMRFDPIRNPTPVGAPVVDAVPDSVRVYGDQLLISFLTGFPFAPGNSRVLAVDPRTRTAEPFIFNLTSAVDVLYRPMESARPQFFVLEFSRNQSQNPAPPGRLLAFDTPEGRVMADNLIAPVSLAFDPNPRYLYVLELTGRILRFELER